MTKFILLVIAVSALCTPAMAQPNIHQPEQMLAQQQDQTARTAAASRDHIREAQRALLRKGYDPGPVDGIFGPKTEGALRQFQEAEQLPVTGRLDDRSLAALNSRQTEVGREKSTGPKETPTPTRPSTPQETFTPTSPNTPQETSAPTSPSTPPGPQETSAPSPGTPQETSIQGSPPSGDKSANQTMTSAQDSPANQSSTLNQKPAPEEPKRSWWGSLWEWLWGR